MTLTVRLHACFPPRLAATQLARSSVLNLLIAPTGLSPALRRASRAHRLSRSDPFLFHIEGPNSFPPIEMTNTTVSRFFGSELFARLTAVTTQYAESNNLTHLTDSTTNPLNCMFRRSARLTDDAAVESDIGGDSENISKRFKSFLENLASVNSLIPSTKPSYATVFCVCAHTGIDILTTMCPNNLVKNACFQ